MNMLISNLKQVQQRLIQAAEQAGRPASDIRLIAVSKTKPAEAIEQVYQAGQHDFGENYLQEALDKIAALNHLTDIVWHFIGSIQSNKTRPIAEQFDWVHTVDRLKIARRLSEQRPPHLPDLNICIQINVSQEDSKAGISLDEAAQLAHDINQLDRLKLRGLMAIPLNTDDPALQHQFFRDMKQCLDQLNQQGLQLDTLSMGMSGDMETAIAEGATMIRVGTAIFGGRAPK
jgi:pyridoxal phosphate enzyme (YggS family)